MDLLEIKLSDEIMENLPSDKAGMIQYLSKHFDEVLRKYDEDFQRRVPGMLGAPLSRYEKSLLKDFLLSAVLGRELKEQMSGSPFEGAAEAVSK